MHSHNLIYLKSCLYCVYWCSENRGTSTSYHSCRSLNCHHLHMRWFSFHVISIPQTPGRVMIFCKNKNVHFTSYHKYKTLKWFMGTKMHLQMMCWAAPYAPHQSADAGELVTALNPNPLYIPRSPSAFNTFLMTSKGPLQYVAPGSPWTISLWQVWGCSIKVIMKHCKSHISAT